MDDWQQLSVDRLKADDLVMWGAARKVESVAGNQLAIVATFTNGEKQTWPRGTKVWVKTS